MLRTALVTVALALAFALPLSASAAEPAAASAETKAETKLEAKGEHGAKEKRARPERRKSSRIQPGIIGQIRRAPEATAKKAGVTVEVGAKDSEVKVDASAGTKGSGTSAAKSDAQGSTAATGSGTGAESSGKKKPSAKSLSTPTAASGQ